MDRSESVQNLSDEALITLAARAKARADEAKQEADDYKDEIRRRFEGTKTAIKTDSGIEVTLTYPRKFDPKLAMELLTDQELAKIMVTKPDGTLAKKVLAPDDYREVTYPDTTRVGFKVL